MSADNWAKCPRCYKRGLDHIDELQEEVDSIYGQVTIEEFDAARERLEQAKMLLEDSDATFREDYEFWGAEDGVVHVDYLGQCAKCGLKIKFNEEHPILGIED